MKNEKCLKTTSKKALHRFTALAAVLLAVCLAFMTPAAAETWDGTSVDTTWYNDASTGFTISTPAQLAGLAKLVNDGNTFEGKTVKLDADIDLEKKEWTPIGDGSNENKYFTGTFDGNGKTISGLSITGTDKQYVGLFGYIEPHGMVKNLAVSGEIDVSNSGDTSAGGIAGKNEGSITSCYFIGTKVSATSTSSTAYAGGIAGHNEHGENNGQGTISNCFSICEVEAVSSGGFMSLAFAGGISGQSFGTIEKCYTTGDITATQTGGNIKQAHAGGIAGQITNGKITSCYALNEKISASGSTANAARIFASNNGGTFSQNYGLKHMKVNDADVTENVGASNKNGESVCAGAIQSAGWESNTWDMFGNGQYLLPVLKGLSGQPTATPNHIGTVTVTFIHDDENPASYTQTVLEGGKVTKPEDPTKTGYKVEGWYKEKEHTNVWTFETDTLGCKDTQQSMTLYAKWTPITYTVKFNPNGGTGDMQNQEFKYGETKSLTTNAFTKEGHDFVGWALSENGEVKYNDGADGSKLTTTANELVNLYAKWTPDIYTVKFNANGGDGTMTDQRFTYGVSQKLNKSEFTRTDYTFNGWMLEQNGVLKYGDEATVSYLPYDEDSKEITLYANWTFTSSAAPTTHTVTFKDGENVVSQELVSDGEKVQQPQVLPKTGYTLSGWNKEDGTEWNFNSDTVNADTTLIANWTGNTYTVKFNANGGDGAMADQTFTYGTSQTLTANAFSKTGHSFEGWADTEGGSVKYTDGQSVSYLAESGTVNLYAVWKINQYTITFDTQGGSTIDSIRGDYGATVNRPADPTKKGYTFNGWDNQIPTTMSAQDTTITAQWKPITYFVMFYANGGSGSMDKQSFTYDVNQALTANNFTAPSGKVFVGWNTKADGTGTAYADKATLSTLSYKDYDIITLYAQWKSPNSGSGSHSTTKTTYTVTFNANGGAGEMFPQTFTSGKEKALNLNFFTKEGYTFAGWATSADGDVVYTDGETIKVSKSMTLYAVWESNEPVNPEQPGDNPDQPGDEPENPEKPTEPETPAPILAVLAGLGAAVVLRRK